MLEPPRLSYLAETQLAAWEKLAADWPAYPETDGPTGVVVMRCASCHIAMWRITDEHGTAYQYSDGQRTALAVAHLRQAHMDLDPDHG